MGVSINLTLPDYVIGGEPATPRSSWLTADVTGTRTQGKTTKAYLFDVRLSRSLVICAGPQFSEAC